MCFLILALNFIKKKNLSKIINNYSLLMHADFPHSFDCTAMILKFVHLSHCNIKIFEVACWGVCMCAQILECSPSL